MNALSRIHPDPQVLAEAFDGETVLHHRGRNVTMLLNETADAVWRLCQDAPTLRELVDTLAEAYGQDPARIAADIEALLSEWCESGVIGLSDDPA